MTIDTCHLAELMEQNSPELGARLIPCLDTWAVSAPKLGKKGMTIAKQDNPRLRRIAFWEELPNLDIHERSRLLEEILSSAWREERDGLRLLFTLLCGRPTTFLYPERIAELRNLRRFGGKLLFHEMPLPDEVAWIERLKTTVRDTSTEDNYIRCLEDYGDRLVPLLSQETRMSKPFERELADIVILEGEAASLRGGRLVESVGDYDPQALARLLPIVVALDEWQGDLKALAEKGADALKHPLDQFLGEEDIKAWQKHLRSSGQLSDLIGYNWIKWMNTTELIGNEPAAWVALLRTLAPKQYKRTLYAAFILPQAWRNGRLQLSKRPPQELFSGKAVNNTDDAFWVDLSHLLWSEWVSPDGLPMSPAKWRLEETPLQLLRSRLQDDNFCDKILNNEGWIARHGVVEIIARGSRSLKILLRICRTRKMYTGSANRGVPLAILNNPTGIPIGAVRSFLSPRYISRLDLMRIARGGPDIREDISKEAQRLSQRI
ncbi:MAG: hypothetical protein GY835_21425 [bacterium]|nr:hypothetical protein [bacterium]